MEFTDRELDVLVVMARVPMASRRTIARELEISVHTVDFHVRNIASKLPGRAPAMRRIYRWLASAAASELELEERPAPS